MKFRSLHHVNIVVADVDEALAFYTQVLGLSLIDYHDEEPRSRWHLQVAHSQIHLTVGGSLPVRGQHYALEVKDFDETLTELERAGVTIVRREDGRSRRQVSISDPSGNAIEIRATEDQL